MAITAQPYGQFLADITKGVHNLGTDTDYIALLTSAYTPDLAGHTSMANVASYEVSGTGYTAGGAAVSLSAATYTAGSTNAAIVPAADVSWAAISATFRYAVAYKKTGTSASSNMLMVLFDFGTDRAYSSSPLKLSFPNGFMSVSKA